ncbi:ABC transporter permease [Actinotalea fermentans]|uniref:Transport permease protein n=1 Tax=Actinotalea fermentans TaxID=43671 RepID=A0A511YVQ2_9CELL|nr:ABC transporter permease [Actinotalea fermentans]GEN79284.1 transport permease protein [Actinotalea fermentans]
MTTTYRSSGPGGAAPSGIAHRLARALPMPAGAGMARTLVERNFVSFRRTWTIIVSGFFEPVFFLFAMGVGIGSMVGDIQLPDGGSVPYLAFVAPALLASSAMNGAVFDSTTNVFFKLKYAKLYDSVLSTPLGPRDVAIGEISWALLRGLVYSGAFLVVAWLAGAVESLWALAAVPAATLIGWAFASVGMASATYMRTWADFDYIQLAIMPMFLFSATFFPLTTYPQALQWLVQATPLYHGVAMTRELMLGDVSLAMVGHVGYLAVMGMVGTLWTAGRVERLLLK